MEVLSSKFDQMNPRFDDFDFDFDSEWQSKLYKRQNISKNQEDDFRSVMLFASFVTLMTILLPFLSKCISA